MIINSESHVVSDMFHVNYEVKVKLSLFMNKHHAMKAYWREEVQLHSFFDLGTRWR
jgi:hypothetical protein